MSRKSAGPLALLLATSMSLLPLVACSQATPTAPPAADAKLRPLPGKLPPFCETCGTVVAITRVAADAAPKLPSAASSSGKQTRGEHFEVVVRLNAGTQQIVTLDSAPQLTIGQRVRITDGVVLPEIG